MTRIAATLKSQIASDCNRNSQKNHCSGSKRVRLAVPWGQKLAICAKIGNFLLFIGSDFLLEIQFLAILGQYSFQQYFFGSLIATPTTPCDSLRFHCGKRLRDFEIAIANH